MINSSRKQAHDLAIVTSYFNPSRYETKRRNYSLFVEGLSWAAENLTTIECAFEHEDFELPARKQDRRVRSASVLWQKERLLNIAISQLPSKITKVAWVDCDLIFENDNWAYDVSRKLDEFNVLQPFETAVRLPPNCSEDIGEGDRYVGFAATFQRNPIPISPFDKHGHTGFAWAARREVLQFGLYDACISGNGDHLMAHAFAGDWETLCFKRHFDDTPRYKSHFESWCSAMYPHVRARIGYVPGKVLHLWHGNINDRRYFDRNRELNAFEYDPAVDIRLGADQCFEWNSPKAELHRWAQRYFSGRNEDGAEEQAITTREALISRLERTRDRAVSSAHARHLTGLIVAVKSAHSMEEAESIAGKALDSPKIL